jgi:hypothetical protein
MPTLLNSAPLCCYLYFICLFYLLKNINFELIQSNIRACLSAKITMHNIGNWNHTRATKTSTSRHLGIYAFSFRTFISFFDWYFPRYCIRQASFMNSWFNRFIFSEEFCKKVLFFCSSWSLASVKGMWFKTFMSESIVRFKRPDNQIRKLNWKIWSVRKWKFSG